MALARLIAQGPPPLARLLGSCAVTCLSALSAQAQWSATILHQSGTYYSEIWAVNDTQQGGRVRPTIGETHRGAIWTGAGPWADFGAGGIIYGLSQSRQVGELGGRASLWSGTPGSRVELFGGPSAAYSVAGNQQAGYIWVNGDNRAAVWSGSAGSLVDLHPAAAVRSEARATDGQYQWGGAVYSGPNGTFSRALRWEGSAQSAVDFTPPGAVFAAVLGVGGGQQAGSSTMSGSGSRATVWNGTPGSWLDIHPFPGFGSSQLYATSGAVQVGWSHVPGFSSPKAGAWFGSAQSFVNLTQFLPAGFGGESIATSVFEHNGITYIGGFADGPSGQHHAVLWTYIPAPGTLALLAAVAVATPRRRRF